MSAPLVSLCESPTLEMLTVELYGSALEDDHLLPMAEALCNNQNSNVLEKLQIAFGSPTRKGGDDESVDDPFDKLILAMKTNQTLSKFHNYGRLCGKFRRSAK
eukprot:scaffold96569_cov61-Attheya_sp.AAC.2